MKRSHPKGRGKAVVLLSGGLDSATTLYMAAARGYRLHALAFDYGQRHDREVRAARRIAAAAGVACDVIRLRLPWKGSALLDKRIPVPASRPLSRAHDVIPATYVPARNIVFLSLALSCAEAEGAGRIFIGANAIDYSGYPDCRPAFYRAFARAARQGTKAGTSGRAIRIETPLIRLTKAQIIREGTRLGVPYALTWSCYKGGARPCGVCDSCRLRAKGFREAGVSDPALRRC
ncbi:MAG: 7-cyano-7-deazaguanine synthase QueC [Deltaproteobacteria bacterium]